MTWTSHGDAVCDSCGEMRMGHLDRHYAIQMLRAAGWHHAIGVTIGGVRYEVILCTPCVKDEHKRPKRTIQLDQEETLPIDWERLKIYESGPGGHSR
jgi:hypothetical protein